MLKEYAALVFDDHISDPLLGMRSADHAGFALKIEEGLEFLYIRSKMPFDANLIRKASPNKDLLAVYFFYGSTFDYYVEDMMEKSVEGLINGIIIHNYSSNVKLSLLKDQEFNFVVVRINVQVLEKYFTSIAADLKELMFRKKPVLIYENLNQNILDHLRSVAYVQTVAATSRFLIFGKSIELLSLAFNMLLTRGRESELPVMIPAYDFVVSARDYLVSDWRNPPTIKQLSEYMAMSPTKAKIVFKQVFGYPPHQYFKRKRMEMAYQLIMESGSNMAEVGYQLGYKNLGHFSSDFKKHFGVLPKRLSMQVKGPPDDKK